MIDRGCFPFENIRPFAGKTLLEYKIEQLKHVKGLDGVIVATKADKVSRNQIPKQIKMIRQTLRLEKDDIVIPVSALKRTGYEELLDVIEGLLGE